MKLDSVLLSLFITVFFLFTFDARAQDKKSAAETVESLRSQLQEVQAKEAELQARLRQLDEDLKPENIERYFAGVGSTRPEELRELRRSQLNRERANVNSQLEHLAGRRARLESSLLNAESAAYHQSAQSTSSPDSPMLFAQLRTSPPWLFALAGLLAVLGLGALIIVVRRIGKV